MLFFAGTFSEQVGQVTRVIVPTQRTSAVGCEPDPTALERVADELVGQREVLLMQLHSHPGGAFLSVTDQTYPASRKVGWLSAVAPSFGETLGEDLDGLRVYEYVDRDQWHELEPEERDHRLVVEA